jgi:glutamyl-tRNA reductase
VFLYDIDDLQQVVEANLAERRREIPRVQSIIQEEVNAFLAWFLARDAVPTIVDLRQHVEQIRERETEWVLQKLDHLSAQERDVILTFGRRLVNKILHQPTVRLKQHANSCEAYRYTGAVRDLFGIGDGEHEPLDGRPND